MKRPLFKKNSITTKLVLLNILILFTFASVMITNLILSQQTKDQVIAIVDQDVPQVIKNSGIVRKLSHILTDIHFMVSTFTVNPDYLDTYSNLLLGSLEESSWIAPKNKKNMSSAIDLFSETIKTIISQCSTILKHIKTIETIEKDLILLVSQLEREVTDMMIHGQLEEKAYERYSLEQVNVILPDLLNLILQIKLNLLEARQIFTHQSIRGSDNESTVLEKVQDFESNLSVITTAGAKLRDIGKELSLKIKIYRAEIMGLYIALRILQDSTTVLDNAQSQVTAIISETDKDIAIEIASIKEMVITNLQSAYTLTFVFSIVGIAILIVVGFLGVRIVKPIQDLTTSAKEMAEGNLESNIPINGSDESGQLARSFLKMRDAIKDQMENLAQKNEALHQEIKERERTELALRESEKKYRTLLENIPQRIFYKNAHSVYVSCNENFAKDLNITPEDIRGKTDFDFFTEDLAQKYIADDKRITETGLTEDIEERYMKNGHTLVVNTVKTPVKDENGMASGILGIFWDITEKKRVEDELRQFERIVSTSTDLLALVNTQYIFQAVNDAFLTSYQKKRKNIIGRPISEILGEEIFQEKGKFFLDRCLKGEENNFQDWFYFPKSGRKFMDVNHYPYMNPEGEVTGIVINLRDITRLKHLETQLVQFQKMQAIGTLAGGIAHDFNNILSAIIGYTELAQLDAPGLPKLNSHLAEVLKAAGRAKDLVYQILIFSRQSEIQKKPLNIAPIVTEALKMLRASIPATIDFY